MNLGKMILELRKKKNVTQEELAAELGVNYLLNVGPDGLGRIPSFCREALMEAAPIK